jgi:hypothetical protein
MKYEGQYALFKSRDKVCKCESKKGKGQIKWCSPERERILKIRNGMIYRCHNKKSHAYERYGLAGIHVCAEWLQDSESFYQWSLNNGYASNLTIDRIDNEQGYSPENCRWITKEAQGKNTRRITDIEDVQKIKDLLATKMRHKAIANLVGVSLNVVRRINCKMTWNEID